ANRNQRDADDTLAPRREQVHRRQQIAKENRQQGHDDDAGGVAESPRPAGKPSTAAIFHRERRDRRQMVGPRQHMEQTGKRAGQRDKNHLGAILMAPSSRITSPFNISFSIMWRM